MIGIFCLGAGGNPDAITGGGGGGLAMKTKRVTPGQIIQYTIASSIATCDGMTANPASGITGGTASGGTYNFAGGSRSSTAQGGGGCGGNSAALNAFGGGSMGHWGQTSRPNLDNSNVYYYGGLGMNLTAYVKNTSSNFSYYGGGGFGIEGNGLDSVAEGYFSGGVGRPPSQLGIFVTSDITDSNNVGITTANRLNNASQAGDWNGGGTSKSSSGSFICQYGGIGSGGGSGNNGYDHGGNGGFGGGGGSCNAANSSFYAGNGGFGGGGGRATNQGVPGNGGFGGGGGKNSNNGYSGTPGSACVAIVY
jgi:hypothetical protein